MDRNLCFLSPTPIPGLSRSRGIGRDAAVERHFGTPRMIGGKLTSLRNRLKTVRTALKVTGAMRLVSAARIRRMADMALKGRPFVQSLEQVMGTVLERLNSDGRSYQKMADEAVRKGGEIDPVDSFLLSKIHRAVQQDEYPRRTLLVVIAGDRGLCGIYNRLVFATARRRIEELLDRGMEVELCCVGRVTLRYFKMTYPNILIVNSFDVGSSAKHGGLSLSLAEEAFMDFVSDEVDRVEILYTRFISLLASKPSIRTLLPLNPQGVEWEDDELFQLVSKQNRFIVERFRPGTDEKLSSRFSKRVNFEQDPIELLCAITPLYIRYQVLRALRESAASELASRLSAMSAAEDNAKELQKGIQLELNRQRQELITNELNEIVGGIAMVQAEDNLF